MSWVDRLFPGFREAKREFALKRPRHFRPLAGAFASPPPGLGDRPELEIARLNQHSRAYFEREDLRQFWMNKPYSEPPFAGRILARFGQLLTALELRPGDRVLDFGCGTGWASIMLARMGLEVVGMDISPAALALARAAAERDLRSIPCPAPEFVCYGGSRIDAEDGAFDAVVVFEAFHHLPNPNQVMREFARVLAPNCRLGMAEPGLGHADSGSSMAETAHGVLEEDLDLEQLHRTGLEAGFGGMEVLVPGLHPHALTLPMRRLRWFMRGWSWLVPADQLRLAILHAPLLVFWTGPHFVSSLHPRDQSAAIRPARSEVSGGAGAAFILDVSVTNTGATVWLREGRHGRGFVTLGAHLISADGAVLDSDYGRAPLPRDLARGEEAALSLHIRAPGVPGRYVVRLDMVNEGMGWFAEGRSATVDVGMTVVEPAAGAR
jgi:2-polyprenyl-3-methyl-5-hydroxy-6-metoxy-1,4-benzoquinol methylase